LVLAAALATTLAATPLYAQNARPTEASVRKLLAAAHLDALLGATSKQVEASLRAGMKREIEGQPLNAKQLSIMDGMQEKMVAIMNEELDWTRMQDHVVELYRDTFTQQEVNGMLAWYNSPTGKAVVAKEPLIMQKVTDETQRRVRDMVPRLMQLQKETAAQLKAAASPPEASDGPPAAPPAPAPAKP
jgi:hypothetical protein